MRDRQKRPPESPVPAQSPATADIESRVAERTRELEAARAELEAKSRQIEEVDRLKNAFIANMSHEIRTPLNSVLALTQLLREGVAGPLTVDQRKYLQVIERNGRGLLHLINDVLDLSRIEAGHLEVDTEDLDLRPHVESVVEALAPLAAAKNIDLAVNLPPELPTARGDPDRFRQILTNLIGNAIKFTDNGGQVMVGAEAHPETIVVVVTDTGVGIPDPYREKIFQEFYQVDQTLVRRQGGTGLGLAIARRLARLMGGDITVESVVSRGSRFSIKMPRASGALTDEPETDAAEGSPATSSEVPQARPMVGSPASRGSAATSMAGGTASGPASPSGLSGAAPEPLALPAMVLVVEDNEDNLFTLRQILARRRLEIVTATNGRQAIERCRRQPPPDLVIMDVQMPGMTGLQATGAIRALPGGAAIPILALTAQAMRGDRERILAAGCDEYLAKPVQPNELISAVDRLLRPAGQDATISPRAAPSAGPSPDQSTADTSDGPHTPRR
jgi:signal transduction histidine kinase/DNA-binding NarL/FixJ family response regulator